VVEARLVLVAVVAVAVAVVAVAVVAVPRLLPLVVQVLLLALVVWGDSIFSAVSGIN
jgi:hypothetical protein